MSDLTRLLSSIESGERNGEELLLLVYAELRRVAAQQMAKEGSGHTLQPTALVHEAWMRLGGAEAQNWQNRAHFFGAAAEAMRRILVEHARRKKSQKRGGGAEHQELDEAALILTAPPDELLAVHEALDGLASVDPEAAELVKLRYFMGMTMEDSASALGVATRAAERLWTFARAWLRREIGTRR